MRWTSSPAVTAFCFRPPRADGSTSTNFRMREWVPALAAAGVEHRRMYDMRHTFTTWSLAGMSIFTLSRRMGTSVQMIAATYGHSARDAEDQDRDLLNATTARTAPVGTTWARIRPTLMMLHEETSAWQAFVGARPRGFEPLTFGSVDRGGSAKWRAFTRVLAGGRAI